MTPADLAAPDPYGGIPDVTLDPIDTDDPTVDTELVDHPDEVTPEQAEAGHRVWLACDDLDDQSTGLEP